MSDLLDVEKIPKVGNSPVLTYNKRAILALNYSPVDFSHFPLISLCKTIDPPIRAIFGPRAII